MKCWLPWLSLLTLLVSTGGQLSADPPAPEASVSASQLVYFFDEEEKPEAPKARTTTEGNWLIYLCRGGRDIPVALVAVTKKEDGTLEAKMLQKPESVPPLKLESAKVDKDNLDLVFDLQGGTPLVVDAKLHQGKIVGSINIGGSNLAPSVSVPYEGDTIKAADANVKQSEGLAEFQKATQAENPVAAILEFLGKNPASPIVPLAGGALTEAIGAKQEQPEKVEGYLRDYFKALDVWGTDISRSTKIETAVAVAQQVAQPELARKLLKEVTDSLQNEMAKERYGAELEAASQVIELSEARVWLASGTEEQKKEALVRLEKINDGTNGEILYLLADHAANSGKEEEALAKFAQIVVLPGLERRTVQALQTGGSPASPPTQRVAELWKKIHGNTDKLEEYLTAQYKQALSKFNLEKTTQAQPKQKVALVELFTGAMCPPCVSADLATGAIETGYGHDQVVVIRYHQHIPGPDPLTIPDGVTRFGFYDGQGTPTVTVNGAEFQGPGGFLEDTLETRDRLQADLTEALKGTSDVTFDLKAEAKDGKLNLSAAAKGLPEKVDDLRLHVVLVEKEIVFAARNGIRLHEMIVRSLPAGPDGAQPADGKLSFEKSLDLGEVKQATLDYLAAYEKQSGFKFPDKPVAWEHLQLVAFVQNEKTREVLQTAIIPVTGELAIPEQKEKKTE